MGSEMCIRDSVHSFPKSSSRKRKRGPPRPPSPSSPPSPPLPPSLSLSLSLSLSPSLSLSLSVSLSLSFSPLRLRDGVSRAALPRHSSIHPAFFSLPIAASLPPPTPCGCRSLSLSLKEQDVRPFFPSDSPPRPHLYSIAPPPRRLLAAVGERERERERATLTLPHTTV